MLTPDKCASLWHLRRRQDWSGEIIKGLEQHQSYRSAWLINSHWMYHTLMQETRIIIIMATLTNCMLK